MANLNKSVLGKVSGALGDLVFRQTKTGNVIAVRPKSFIPGTDQESVDRRSKFGLSCKLASAINNIPELYQVWSEFDSKRTPFLNIMKSNYPYVDPAGIPGKFKLTPEEGFGTNVVTANVTPLEVSAEIDPIGDNAGIDTDEELTVRLVSLIYLSEPVDEFAPSYRLLRLSSEEVPIQLDNSLVFTIPLMSQQTELYNAYSACEAYFALVTLDAEGNVINYSNTFRKV
jgi:hypothetical protein